MEEDRMRSGRMWELYRMGGFASAMASVFRADQAEQMALIRSVLRDQRTQHTLFTPLSRLKTAVFDLETTGFQPSAGDEIISMGAVLMEGARLEKDGGFYTLVKPSAPIPPDIVQLTGITNDMADRGLVLIEALKRFLKHVNQRVLIAHSANHDKAFLNAALWKTSRVRLSHRLIDTMLVAKWLRPDLKTHGLDEVLDAFAIPKGRRHHALEDANMTARLWGELLGHMEERGVQTLGDLYTRLGSVL